VASSGASSTSTVRFSGVLNSALRAS